LRNALYICWSLLAACRCLRLSSNSSSLCLLRNSALVNLGSSSIISSSSHSSFFNSQTFSELIGFGPISEFGAYGLFLLIFVLCFFGLTETLGSKLSQP